VVSSQNFWPPSHEAGHIFIECFIKQVHNLVPGQKEL
jgi:hypothetical protein